MNPSICTQTTQSHVDYGIPLFATKFTDYRTSTGTYHQYIPDVPRHCIGCRVKPRLYKPELKAVDVVIRDDRQSLYNLTYVPVYKDSDPVKNHNNGPQLSQNVHYIRSTQEKLIKDPPPPIAPKLSEMKDSFRVNFYRPRFREVAAPATAAKCELAGLARPLQPVIPPGEHGFWKYLDNYMTDNRLRFPPYKKEQQEQALEDLPTIYSACGKYKSLKSPLPGPLTGNKSVYDKSVYKNSVFKYQMPIRFLSKAPKNVPSMNFKTEYSGSYIPQTYSDLFPYINSNGVRFEDIIGPAGPWQNLCPPGMYCTESCHIGTGRPVRTVVPIGRNEPLPPHDCPVKIERWV